MDALSAKAAGGAAKRPAKKLGVCNYEAIFILNPEDAELYHDFRVFRDLPQEDLLNLIWDIDREVYNDFLSIQVELPRCELRAPMMGRFFRRNLMR